MNGTMPFLARFEGVLLLGAVAMYFVAMLLLWALLFFRVDEPEEHGRTWHEIAETGGRALLVIGANLHLLAMIGQGRALFEVRAGVAGLFGWTLIVTWLFLGRRVTQSASAHSSSGAFVMPLALLAALYSLTAPVLHRYTPAPGRLETQWLVIHVLTTLAGYVALAFAFAASLIYLVQEGLLKRKQLRGLWQRLPSLQVADEVIYRATAFGLSLLTLGLALGVAWYMRHQAHYEPWRDPKVLWSGLTWLTFALYLASRLWLGWRGRRTNMVVVYGFVLLVISFFGAPHVLK